MTLRQQQTALQAALMAQAVGSTPQVRLAPPTYHVPGVPMIGHSPACAAEGDYMLRFLDAEQAIDDGEAELDETIRYAEECARRRQETGRAA